MFRNSLKDREDVKAYVPWEYEGLNPGGLEPRDSL